ncbi:hypothetical protein ACELLULO517_09505 [Acidisoma cellulosilytica]|uniref:Sulfotransferase domain-containing protein n=1 Tax=Acidisoma cellulosilyticum TaxID=2802395 RepID=A0A963Z1X6_9PROT|nr:hypothetical protein [Acidisoma cellulosilyticum]MCB8880467.1 hypothetical protein [Acidisoma cellulosilyticum]
MGQPGRGPEAAARATATAGLHGSASTWVFNIVRELLTASLGPDKVLSFYADDPAVFPSEVAQAGRHLVVKFHFGGPALDDWLTAQSVPVVLSLRDPRDAVISMALRFRAPLAAATQWVANDCNAFARLAARGHPVLRYENRFFDQPRTIALLAAQLGLPCDLDLRDRLFARYEAEAVKEFAAGLENLPPERQTLVAGHRMDRLTQILAPHIGDGRSGKWRDLPEAVGAELTQVFEPFLKRFGYTA